MAYLLPQLCWKVLPSHCLLETNNNNHFASPLDDFNIPMISLSSSISINEKKLSLCIRYFRVISSDVVAQLDASKAILKSSFNVTLLVRYLNFCLPPLYWRRLSSNSTPRHSEWLFGAQRLTCYQNIIKNINYSDIFLLIRN